MGVSFIRRLVGFVLLLMVAETANQEGIFPFKGQDDDERRCRVDSLVDWLFIVMMLDGVPDDSHFCLLLVLSVR